MSRLQFRVFLCCCLPLLHPLPVYKSVQIIGKEHHKADDDGQIAEILPCGQNPKHDQHHVVGCIGQGEVGTAAEGQIYRNEAGGDGKGAGDDMCGFKVSFQF